MVEGAIAHKLCVNLCSFILMYQAISTKLHSHPKVALKLGTFNNFYPLQNPLKPNIWAHSQSFGCFATQMATYLIQLIFVLEADSFLSNTHLNLSMLLVVPFLNIWQFFPQRIVPVGCLPLARLNPQFHISNCSRSSLNVFNKSKQMKSKGKTLFNINVKR